MGLFGFFNRAETDTKTNPESEKVVETTEVVVYAPASMNVQQKFTIVGAAFFGCLGLSYLFQYILYMIFGGVCVSVIGYDTEWFINFVNNGTFLNDRIVKRFNALSHNLVVYLTPSKVGDGANTVVAFSTGVFKHLLPNSGSLTANKSSDVNVTHSDNSGENTIRIGPNGKKID